MAVMKPKGSDPFYDMITSALAAPPVPANPFNTTASNSAPIHGVDYYMAIAQKNLLTVQQTIDHQMIENVGEDAMKKRIKSDIASQIAQEMVENKITFTAQDNRLELTRIVRAKTYVFTHDELVKFVEKCIK